VQIRKQPFVLLRKLRIYTNIKHIKAQLRIYATKMTETLQKSVLLPFAATVFLQQILKNP
jgi:hypothetical protein